MERVRFESELEHLGLERPRAEYQVGGAATSATLGFEFDLNYGVNQGVFDARKSAMPAGATFPREHEALTTHRERDGANKLVDGFSTRRDGPRMEISTTPFAIDDDAEFDAVVANVVKFARELQAAKKTRDTGITVSGIAGHPVRMEHPKTVIARLPLVIHQTGSAAKGTLRFPTATALWAAPQATVTLPLANVGRLIYAIKQTEGGAPGVALTGRPSQRLGLRSDLAWTARLNMLRDRRRKIGMPLSDKSSVSEADYSPAVASLVTLLVMYLLTSEKTDPRDDVEGFAKGSLPLNVKTPFREIFKEALTEREKLVFRELYGNPGVRQEIFRLAKPGATAADDGDNRLFPTRTHADLDRFHSTPPTWNTLIEHTISGTPLKVTKANTVSKKNHAVGDEILFAPLSSKIPFARTKPRIAIELRRIGFAPVPVGAWKGLMVRVRKLVQRLNA